jgi:hypothetical protein
MNRQCHFPSRRNTKLRRRRATSLAASGILLAIFGYSGSAQANESFESGFEFEMGRLAANHLAAMTHLAFGRYARREVVVVEANPRHAHRRHVKPVHHHHARCGHATRHRTYAPHARAPRWGHRGHVKFGRPTSRHYNGRSQRHQGRRHGIHRAQRRWNNRSSVPRHDDRLAQRRHRSDRHEDQRRGRERREERGDHRRGDGHDPHKNRNRR